MQRRDALVEHYLKHRKLQQVDMEVDDIEFRGPAPDMVKHDQCAGGMITNTGEAKCFWSHRQEPSGRLGIRGCK